MIEAPGRREVGPRLAISFVGMSWEIRVSKLLYQAQVDSFDAELGRLMEGLDRLGLKEDCLIVLTADHGEAFGERPSRATDMGPRKVTSLGTDPSLLVDAMV
jgi:arylsulfatase A-like enzyme